MEAASVAQATQTALTNALEDLTKMEIRFQENAERSNQERTRARISAKVRPNIPKCPLPSPAEVKVMHKSSSAA